MEMPFVLLSPKHGAWELGSAGRSPTLPFISLEEAELPVPKITQLSTDRREPGLVQTPQLMTLEWQKPRPPCRYHIAF